LATGDKGWFVSEQQHPTEWSAARDQVPTMVSQMISTKNVMLTVIWGIDGFRLVDMIPPWGRFKTKHFLPYIMDPLLAKVFLEGGKSHAL
jgi:hypothetical protein